MAVAVTRSTCWPCLYLRGGVAERRTCVLVMSIMQICNFSSKISLHDSSAYLNSCSCVARGFSIFFLFDTGAAFALVAWFAAEQICFNRNTLTHLATAY